MNAWSIYATSSKITGNLENLALSNFAHLYVFGNAATIRERERLHTVVPGPGVPLLRVLSLRCLLESKEISSQLSPLLLAVAVGKNVRYPPGGAVTNHIGVVRILLEYGGRPDATDVSGRAVCHYRAEVMATEMTLDAVDFCICAAQTSHLLGRDVELRGLRNVALNGARGVAGGSDRRVVYLFDKEREIAMKPANIRRRRTWIYGRCQIPTGGPIPYRDLPSSLRQPVPSPPGGEGSAP